MTPPHRIAWTLGACLTLLGCGGAETPSGDGGAVRNGTDPESDGPTPARSEAERSRAAFLAAYPVFMHARCVNCHPIGDVPLQGDASHPHTQFVERGTDGRGLTSQRCTACHQDTNLEGAGMPPGVLDWRMPDAAMPLVFEGRSAGALARQLVDPEQNGGKTLTALLHHIEDDALVRWGWAPGDGRSTPPLSHAEFVARIREWIDTGAVAPE